MARSTTYKLSAIIGMVDRLSAPTRRMAANAARAFAKIGQGVAGTVRFVSHLTTAIGGVRAALSAASGVITDYVDATDQLAKEARALGVTTRGLSELRHAADRSGLSAEELALGLRSMNKSVEEARIEKGQLFTLLRKTSPAMLEVLKRATTTEEAFSALAGAAGAIQDPMRRSLLLTNAFGRSGAKFASMVGGGTEAIEAMRKEARDLGLAISDDAGTAAEAFKDDMTRLEGSIRGAKAAIAGQLLPILAPLIQDMAKWVVANRELISAKVAEWIERVAAFLRESFVPAMREGRELAGKIGEAIGWMTTHWRELALVLGGLKLAALTASMGGLSAAAVAATASWAGFVLKMQEAQGLINDIRNSNKRSENIGAAAQLQSMKARASVFGNKEFERFVDERLTSGPTAAKVRDALNRRAAKTAEDSLGFATPQVFIDRERRAQQARLFGMDPLAQAAAAGELDRLIGDFKAQQNAAKAELTVQWVGLPDTMRVLRPKADAGVDVVTKVTRNVGASTMLGAPL